MQSCKEEHKDAHAAEWKDKRDSEDEAAHSQHSLPQRKLPERCFGWKVVNAQLERAGTQTCDEHEDAEEHERKPERDYKDDAAHFEHLLLQRTLPKRCFGKIVNAHFAGTI